MTKYQTEPVINLYDEEKTPILYDVEPNVALHRAKLELLLRDYEESRRRPRYEDAFPWLAVGIACLIATLTADFKEVIGIPSGIWGGLILFGAVACLLVVLSKVFNAFKHREETIVTAREVVDGYILELQSKQQ